ncbi:T6SS phospholipase effector Tle1-like catalytic domain-containing protein [Rhizobium mongolense]|uniref:Uncharacterized protein (DUF2235 family) n=1 Tax=Rhizobium mongolense TaxID=57676 RepID=A0A7W6WGQ7_9HYPH|nr:DUF2235 domain-containing protein [Rhizobium mongolense]MBB4277747.1 uncharacterized protein (DUF2235 family) [Rhizobium mongolense]
MKSIVVCCDGTSNQFAADKTNVVRLFSVLARDDDQLTFYHPGLGTMEPPGAITDVGRKLRRTLGMAVGWGLERDLVDAYAYIMNTYHPGDNVYLFGFSRGAYTIRAVAALIHLYGLFPPGNEPLIPYAIRQMTGFNDDDGDVSEKFKLADGFKSTFSSIDCPIHFMGIWDTVSSVGWIANPLSIPYATKIPNVQHIRHAVAIDERRAFFRTNVLARQEPGQPQRDFEEVWFPGSHGDVGGGYEEGQNGLAKLSLEWMLYEAERQGLRFDHAKARAILTAAEAIDENATIHESLCGAWWLAEIVPKKRRQTGDWKANLAHRRVIPEGAKIHRSALTRREYKITLPLNYAVVERPVGFLADVD